MTVRDFPCRTVVQWIAENLDFFLLEFHIFTHLNFVMLNWSDRGRFGVNSPPLKSF